MNNSTDNVFKNHLLQGEEILWTGQPDRSYIFAPMDIGLVPFSLLWGGFAIFWEVMVILGNATADFMLFGLPFVLIGLYMIFGRFVYKDYKKKRTFYAVTNKRILIFCKSISDSISASYINTIPTINKTVRANGVGTLKFGNPSLVASWYGNTGMEFMGAQFGGDVPTFYDIKDANKVYDLVNGLRSK